MAVAYSGSGDAARAVSESEVEKLYAKVGQLVVERVFSENLRSMSVDLKQQWLSMLPLRLSISTQCRQLSISRASCHYALVPETDETLALTTVIDATFLDCPWHGSRLNVQATHRSLVECFDIARFTQHLVDLVDMQLLEHDHLTGIFFE